MNEASPHDIGEELLKALDIDPSMSVTRLAITCDWTSGLIRATVEFVPEQEKLLRVLAIVKEHKAVEVLEPKPEGA